MNKEEVIKFFKNKNNVLIAVILIIGVVLMLSSLPTPKKQTSAPPPSDEESLSRILSEIDGAGEVNVMITYYGTAKKDIAYETKTNSSDGEKTNEDKKAVISDGAPMVVKEVYPKVKGVVITAQGANNAAVNRKLMEAATAALDVPEYRVCICQSKK